MIKKLGFMINNLFVSQLAHYLTVNTNNFLLEGHMRDGTLYDVVVFVDQPAPLLHPANFSIMNQSEAWGYDGGIVAVSTPLAEKLLKYPTPKQKFLYLWDLDWTHMGAKSYEALANVYLNPELKIVVRSNDHKRIFETVWGKEVCAVVEDFNVKSFFELIQARPVKVMNDGKS